MIDPEVIFLGEMHWFLVFLVHEVCNVLYIVYLYNGCLSVALNYQTPDEDMHIYKGFFLDNGGSGYILKPSFLTSRMYQLDCVHRKPSQIQIQVEPV